MPYVYGKKIRILIYNVSVYVFLGEVMPFKRSQAADKLVLGNWSYARK